MTVAIMDTEMKEETDIPMDISNNNSTGSVIPLFGKLSDRSAETRIDAAAQLVKLVKTGSNENKDYTLNRLVKGLAANKGWSRPGFTMALISILKNCENVDVSVILDKMDEFLDSSSDSDNVKGVLLGRTFCLASLIKSEQGDLAQHVKIMKELFKILKTKEYLTQENLFILSYLYVEFMSCQMI